MLGIFNMRTDGNACNAHRGFTHSFGESALKVDSGRKIPCRIVELSQPQQGAGLTLYQLSYIPIPPFFVLVARIVFGKAFDCSTNLVHFIIFLLYVFVSVHLTIFLFHFFVRVHLTIFLFHFFIRVHLTILLFHFFLSVNLTTFLFYLFISFLLFFLFVLGSVILQQRVKENDSLVLEEPIEVGIAVR